MNDKPNLPPVSSGLTDRSEAEISEAIRVCYSLCETSPDRTGCVEAHVIGLIASGWSARDAREVKDGALGVLATIDSLL